MNEPLFESLWDDNVEAFIRAVEARVPADTAATVAAEARRWHARQVAAAVTAGYEPYRLGKGVVGGGRFAKKGTVGIPLLRDLLRGKGSARTEIHGEFGKRLRAKDNWGRGDMTPANVNKWATIAFGPRPTNAADGQAWDAGRRELSSWLAAIPARSRVPRADVTPDVPDVPKAATPDVPNMPDRGDGPNLDGLDLPDGLEVNIRDGDGTAANPFLTADPRTAAALLGRDQHVRLDAHPGQVTVVLDEVRNMAAEIKKNGPREVSIDEMQRSPVGSRFDVNGTTVVTARGGKLLGADGKMVDLADLADADGNPPTVATTKPPTFDLCKLHVPGTNLFCEESKGIPRAKMPQLSGVPREGSPAAAMERNADGSVNVSALFPAWLEKRGIPVTRSRRKVKEMKATQVELDGGKSGGIMQGWRDVRERGITRIEDGPDGRPRFTTNDGTTIEGPEAERLAGLTDALFVDRDGYIVDGHHRWAGAMGADVEDGGDADIEMDVLEVDDSVDIVELIALTNQFADEMGIPQAAVGADSRDAVKPPTPEADAPKAPETPDTNDMPDRPGATATGFDKVRADLQREIDSGEIWNRPQPPMIRGNDGGSNGPASAPAGPPDLSGAANLPADLQANITSGDGTVNNPYRTADPRTVAHLLAKDQHVRLDATPGQITVVLDEVKKLAKQLKEIDPNAKKPPVFDLCKLHVPGTNLFCEESKGIPRVEMPQLAGVPLPGTPAADLPIARGDEVDTSALFPAWLEKRGIKVAPGRRPVKQLKATQNELNGATTAGIMDTWRTVRERGITNQDGRIVDADGNEVDEPLAGYVRGMTEPLFISHDGYIVDGHHRWSGAMGADVEDEGDADIEMATLEIDPSIDIVELIALANQFTLEMGIPPRSAAQSAGERPDLGDGNAPNGTEFEPSTADAKPFNIAPDLADTVTGGDGSPENPWITDDPDAQDALRAKGEAVRGSAAAAPDTNDMPDRPSAPTHNTPVEGSKPFVMGDDTFSAFGISAGDPVQARYRDERFATITATRSDGTVADIRVPWARLDLPAADTNDSTGGASIGGVRLTAVSSSTFQPSDADRAVAATFDPRSPVLQQLSQENLLTRLQIADAMEKNPPDTGKAALLQRVMAESQKAFTDRGITHVTLYRGVGVAGAESPWPPDMTALASWTTDPGTALDYASRNGEGTVFRIDVPVDQIVSWDVMGALRAVGPNQPGAEVLVAKDTTTTDRIKGGVFPFSSTAADAAPKTRAEYDPWDVFHPKPSAPSTPDTNPMPEPSAVSTPNTPDTPESAQAVDTPNVNAPAAPTAPAMPDTNDMPPRRRGIGGLLDTLSGRARRAETDEIESKLGGDYSRGNIERVLNGPDLNDQERLALQDMRAKVAWYDQEQALAADDAKLGVAKPRAERTVVELLGSDSSPVHIQALLRSSDLTDQQRAELRRMLDATQPVAAGLDDPRAAAVAAALAVAEQRKERQRTEAVTAALQFAERVATERTNYDGGVEGTDR